LARRGGRDARRPGELPGRERPTGQQRVQHGGPGRLADQPGDRRDVHVARRSWIGPDEGALLFEDLGHGSHRTSGTLRRRPKGRRPSVAALVRHSDFDPAFDAAPPATDDREVSALIPAAVTEVLLRAERWLGRGGTPVLRDGNVWTLHKVLRRVADHLVDHLAAIEARLAGLDPLPDRWHGRRLTLDADWARFTEADLDEAESRPRRPRPDTGRDSPGRTTRPSTRSRPPADGRSARSCTTSHLSRCTRTRITVYADLFDEATDA